MGQLSDECLERSDPFRERGWSRLSSPVVALVRPVVFGSVGVGPLLGAGLRLVHKRHTKPYGPAMQP